MMLRVPFVVKLSAALLAALTGYMGRRAMPAIDRSQRTDVLADPPALRRWQEVTIAVGKDDQTEASLRDVGDWPLRYLALGGLVANLSRPRRAPYQRRRAIRVGQDLRHHN
ncbi:MAG: hypothetical protein FJW38_18390 [Acidobacteria bacterium]|nr:hypothetical protein [Acidobacteriota bacterium]